MRFFWRKKRKAQAPGEAPPSAKPQAVDLRTYLVDFLWSSKWFVLFMTVLGTGLTAVGTYLYPPEWKATVKFQVRSSAPPQMVIFDKLYRHELQMTKTVAANNVIELANSARMARRLVDEFSLDKIIQRKLEQPAGIRETFWAYVEKVKAWSAAL